MAKRQYTVLVVGCGEMGSSHARAYEKIPEYEIVGLVSRNRCKLKVQIIVAVARELVGFIWAIACEVMGRPVTVR